MKRKRKGIRMISLCLLVFFLIGGSVQAEEKGVIRIRLEEGGKGTSRKGVVFAYTKVAEIVNGDFVGEDWMQGIEIDGSSSAKEVQEAACKIAERVKTPDGTVTTDENGTAHIEGLSEGLYLLTVTGKASYDEILPILVSIPSWNEKNGNMEYEVQVIPKHEPKQEENPVAPQTNLNSTYRQKLMSAGVCLFGALMLFVLIRRKEEDEIDL